MFFDGNRAEGLQLIITICLNMGGLNLSQLYGVFQEIGLKVGTENDFIIGIGVNLQMKFGVLQPPLQNIYKRFVRAK